MWRFYFNDDYTMMINNNMIKDARYYTHSDLWSPLRCLVKAELVPALSLSVNFLLQNLQTAVFCVIRLLIMKFHVIYESKFYYSRLYRHDFIKKCSSKCPNRRMSSCVMREYGWEREVRYFVIFVHFRKYYIYWKIRVAQNWMWP